MATTTATYNGYYNISTLDFTTGAFTTEFWGYLNRTTYLSDQPSVPSGPQDTDGTEVNGEYLNMSVPSNTWSSDMIYSGWNYQGAPIVNTIVAPYNFYLVTNNSGIPATGGVATQGIYVYCFTSGTAIATPDGTSAVETLRIGDALLTADGTSVPVKWIGRKTINPLFARLHGEMPIRIAAHALGNGLPVRDLYVSPDHAMLVDGVLVHAQALVNGSTITQVSSWEGDIEYFHIELENHDLVLAEGAAAETFIDNVSRKQFDNWQEFVELYGAESPIPELPLPRVKYQRQLSSVTRQRLMAIALQSARQSA